uniref:BED-type domain-containing protein n=1 Tax=Amphimedon queenslandica TaxID=400682 RepID=A0A1X7U2L3_AMPQE
MTPSSTDESFLGSWKAAPTSYGRSAVWRYFKKVIDERGEGHVCIVPVPGRNGKSQPCGERKGKHINQCKRHLELNHSVAYEDMLREDYAKKKERDDAYMTKAIKKKSNRPKGMMTKTGVVKEVKEKDKYFRESAEQKALDRTVAMYIRATNAPYSTVNNKYFQIMLQSFQPRYLIPSRSRLICEISDILRAMKGKIQISMSSAWKINFCADIWSKKGLTSYLGITAHYYSTANQCIEHPTLAVREIPHPHTGQFICDLTYQIINDWGIPLNKVQFVITDNGSNMVKAFKSDQCEALSKIEVDKGADIDDDESDHEPDHDPSKDDDDYNDDDDDDVQLHDELEPEGEAVLEFETEERTHNTVFSTQGLKRLSCFSHTLQLVVAAFNKDKACRNLLSKAYKIVKQVSMSGKATEALIVKAGKKLVSNSVTRGSSAYLVVSCLLEVKDDLMIILVQHGLTLLQPTEWTKLEHIKALFSKFAEHNNVAGGEQYPTLSLVIPAYRDLILHLESMEKVSYLKNVAKILLSELNRRFSKLTDPDHPDHDLVYMVVTLFDLRFKLSFTESQTAHAKKECLKLLGEYESGDESEASQPIPPDDDEPPAKQYAYDHVYNKMKRKVTNMKDLKHKNRKLPELQLDGYLQSTVVSVSE